LGSDWPLAANLTNRLQNTNSSICLIVLDINLLRFRLGCDRQQPGELSFHPRNRKPDAKDDIAICGDQETAGLLRDQIPKMYGVARFGIIGAERMFEAFLSRTEHRSVLCLLLIVVSLTVFRGSADSVSWFR
jgi:hypothetical protein